MSLPSLYPLSLPRSSKLQATKICPSPKAAAQQCQRGCTCSSHPLPCSTMFHVHWRTNGGPDIHIPDGLSGPTPMASDGIRWHPMAMGLWSPGPLDTPLGLQASPGSCSDARNDDTPPPPGPRFDRGHHHLLLKLKKEEKRNSKKEKNIWRR